MTSHTAVITRPDVPVGRTGQLDALAEQLLRVDRALARAQAHADRVMRDGEIEERERWDAVKALRRLAFTVSREAVPMVGRVPVSLRAEPGYRECERISHELRRRAEAAMRTNANYTVDLVNAAR